MAKAHMVQSVKLPIRQIPRRWVLITEAAEHFMTREKQGEYQEFTSKAVVILSDSSRKQAKLLQIAKQPERQAEEIQPLEASVSGI